MKQSLGVTSYEAGGGNRRMTWHWFKGELSSLNISKKEPTVWELRELQSPAGEEVTKLRLPFSSWQNGNAVWNTEEELTTLRRMATTHELRTEDFLYLEKAQFHVELCSSCQNYPSICIRYRLFTSQARLTRQCNLKGLALWCEFIL